MDKKKLDLKGSKGNVKFQGAGAPNTKRSGAGTDRDNGKIREKKDPAVVKEFVLKTFNEADSKFKLFTRNDPAISRKDTARGLCLILNSLKEALDDLSSMSSDAKEQFYYLAYNGTIYTYDICRYLRKSVYSTQAIQYIANCILVMEDNLTLYGVKFLDWRVKLYVELARIYEECEASKAALKTIETALAKTTELKELEESDPPVPEHVSTLLKNNIRLLQTLEIKYRLHVSV